MSFHLNIKSFLPIILIPLIAASCSYGQNRGEIEGNSNISQTQTSIAVNHFFTVTPPIPIIDSPTATIPVVTTTPIATQVSDDCENRAELIEETIPDQSRFNPGENFEKKWTLHNSGSCTWNESYSLVFVGGEQLASQNLLPLRQVVPPNHMVELQLNLTAPVEPGYYESFWKIQGPAGDQFGIGFNAGNPLWIKIHSGTGNILGEGLEMGAPDWQDTFNEDKNYLYLGENNITNFEIRDGFLEMTAINPIRDVWRIINLFQLGNVYFELIAVTGDNCTDKDGYGVLLRAPDQEDGVIDSGYVFGFSCDGMYRIYRLDDGDFNSIQLWQESIHIKSGPNQTNRMGIKADGNRFQLFANGELLADFIDSKYTIGIVGLMIRSESTYNLKIYLDEIAYWRNPE